MQPEMIPLTLIDRAALEHLKSKALQGSFSHYDIWLDQHQYAFTVAKMMDADMLAEVRSAIADALANGTGFADFQKRLKPYLMARGWWGEQVMIDPLDGQAKTVQLGSTRRLRKIFETNMATAHAASCWQRIERNAKAMPYLRYNPSASTHKRDDHKRYYGLILPVKHPIWQQIFPPNGYGCKCTVSQLTRGQAEREGISEEPNFEFMEVTNPRTGEVVNVPKDITPSFAHNHAKRVDAVLDLAAQRHGQDFVRDVVQQANDFLSQRVVRPNFDNLDFVPNLILANSDIDIGDAQKIVYAHAGTGSQLGSILVGEVGSFEWFKHGNRHFLMEYRENGVQLNRIKHSELAWLKQNEIMSILEENASPSEWDKLQDMMQQIQELDYGQADFADKLAAYLYSTNGGYMAVNPELIQAKGHLASIPKPRTIQMIRLIDDFLAHAPKYKGTTTRKLAMNRMPNATDFLASHEKGNLVRYSNFSSTSKSDGEFGNSQPDILLTIHGKSGVDISQLSVYAKEGEVLMPRHAVYRVVNQYEENGTVHIELEEVTEKQYNGKTIMQLSLLKG